ncbi:DUF6648 family protein [Peptoniphilus stercorisuis]|uniref:Uncharacterized protein n=1 Tax=Peptoniphilus stercorisuis TaxID=1436965 RepID=A0ABS4KBT8_9FIRM|nr:hypothetical protein [Peptoniphilus stercorisuis]
MGLIKKKDSFEDFMRHRSFLIEKYSNGDISKRDFLQYNYDYFVSVNARPYIKIDSYEKGMYNYQYYNGLAKYYRMLAKEVRNTKKHSKYYNYYLNLGNKYYDNKDESALDILKFQKFENIECYFISCDSKALEDSLYEIVLKDKKEAIFHSKSEELLDILKQKQLFYPEKRESLISEYINERY